MLPSIVKSKLNSAVYVIVFFIVILYVICFFLLFSAILI